MTVVLDRPYRFVAPHRGNAWPALIQTFRIVDFYLKRREGVVDFECRGLEHWKASLDRGDGILLAPNHCRYADPLVLGWPARQLGTHVFAMASWHLFNTGSFDSFAIQKMGGFSINREGSDRQSLETAIGILAAAERPLILFPEGTTNRTNDVLKPLLDGVAFIARSAARRRHKDFSGQLVMHPIALKYRCVGDVADWADRQLSHFESHIRWTPVTRGQRSAGESILSRTIRLAEALLSLKEIEYLGHSQSGDLPARRDQLIQHVLSQSEARLGIKFSGGETRERVRAIRTEVVGQYFAAESDSAMIARQAIAADLAQELMSYPDCYLTSDHVTDTRIVETIQRMQESFFGKADVGIPLKVVIQCDEAIVVPPEKAPRGQRDPLMEKLDQRLTQMVHALAAEGRNAQRAGLT